MKKPNIPPIKINIISLFKLYRLIKKLIKQLNQKSMCFKKKNTQVVPATGEKVALLFGINDYMGNSNDLRGCLNDIDDVEKKLKNEFPGFEIRKFKDSEVTTQRFILEVENVLKSDAKVLYIHYSGHGTNNGTDQALYLYNGPLWESVIQELEDKTPKDKRVTIKLDSCFSGGMDDRLLNPRRIKNRFYQMPGIKSLHKSEKRFAKKDINKWIYFAACGPGQTAADAEFNNRPNGAYTFYDNRSYNTETKNSEEIIAVGKLLSINNFGQIPELDGPEERLNSLSLQ